MSDSDAKVKRSKRIHKEEVAIKKQQKIAKAHGGPEHQYEGHRYAKHHAMDCGQPECYLCSNPRKILKEKTVQEKSFAQTEGWDG